MRVLLTGASGLIGQALMPRLLAQGHTVCGICRHPPAQAEAGLTWAAADMAALTRPDDWQALLVNVDVVINTVGLFRETPTQTFATLHYRAPAALFGACTATGVKRVIHVSALGADPQAPTAYWRSKGLGDVALMQAPLDWVIVRPSLVYADTGVSSQFFCKMAAQPLLAYPADAAAVQPIHLDDLADALAALVDTTAVQRRIVAAVGPRALPFVDWLRTLRASMGITPTGVLPIPAGVMRLASALGRYAQDSLLTPDSLVMLRAGNTADAAVVQNLLPRPLRDPATFTHPGLRTAVILAAWQPWARLSLALLWLWTAFVSLTGQSASLALLAETPLPATWHPAALYAAAGLDGVFGLLTLCCPTRQLWRVQIGLIVAYTLIITFTAAHWWWHPFGPVSKNLPILALLYLLLQLEDA